MKSETAVGRFWLSLTVCLAVYSECKCDSHVWDCKWSLHSVCSRCTALMVPFPPLTLQLRASQYAANGAAAVCCTMVKRQIRQKMHVTTVTPFLTLVRLLTPFLMSCFQATAHISPIKHSYFGVTMAQSGVTMAQA